MLRFTIRDVLWLTVVVAVALGWGIDHWRLVLTIGNWEWRAKQLAQAAEDGGLGKVTWNSDDIGFEIRAEDGFTTVYP